VSEHSVAGAVGAVEIEFSTGRLARLADGAVVVKVGGTEVLATAVGNRSLREGVDFFPLTVDVEEKMYAVGKIPGSFFRREGRATERAILTCRLIDRPLRPSFRDGFRSETHIIVTVLSVDEANSYDVIALNAASAALSVSPIPFEGPIGGVRLAYSNGEWIPMPTFEQLAESVFDLVVAGKRNSEGGVDIAMVEAGATEEALRLIDAGQAPTDEAAIAKGLEEARAYIGQLIDLQLELRSKVEIPEVEWPVAIDYSDEVFTKVDAAARPRLAEVFTIADKKARNTAEGEAMEAVFAELGLTPESEDLGEAKKAFKSVAKSVMRERVINDGVRLDGRDTTTVRPIEVDTGLLASAHGSALFQRGDTQVLNVTTLGMLRMEQMLDTISMEDSKRYMHHYNFPPFSTGETGFMRGPKRREIGHGALAEKAVLPVIPSVDDFPYAYRLVSEVLASNGSSSMASVCGSSLSLMDAGVPIKAAVAGVAMGLIAHDGKFITLTDIIGAEDALGDMDFKVAGTADVITALQLDTKIEGLPAEVLAGALDQARIARLHILDEMNKVLAKPRPELSPNAPRIEAVQVPKDKIGEVIGPKGKMIREIEEVTGATLEIEDDGTIRIGAADGEALRKAKEWVLQIAYPPEAEIGKEYEGEIVNITKFGAFVNILPGRDGLLHISKMGGGRRVENVEDLYNLGDKVQVIVREIDDRGKVSLDLAGDAPEPKADGGSDGQASGGGDDRGNRAPRAPREPKPERSERSGDGRSRDRAPRSDSAPTEKPKADKPGRVVVSFEDEFEGGK
jgi:polyribonucleotide nucleotidyltransferase